jgi:hypothetical protein
LRKGRALLYRLAYEMRRHWLLAVRLDHWLIVAVVLTLLLVVLERFPGPLSLAALIILGGLLLVAGLIVARRHDYVNFAPGPPPANLLESLPPLKAEEKIPLHASGFFEVSGMRRYWVEAQAAFTVFETGECALLARVPRSHLLFLAWTPGEEAGWWYIFFRPEQIRRVTPGQLSFGLGRRPALRIIFQAEAASEEIVHLSFDDPLQLQQVLLFLSPEGSF